MLLPHHLILQAVRKAKENKTTQWTTSSVALYINGGIRSKINPDRNDGSTALLHFKRLCFFSSTYIRILKTQFRSIGAITLGDLLTLLPFENKLYEAEYSGRTLLDALEYSVISYDKNKDINFLPYFLLYSGKLGYARNFFAKFISRLKLFCPASLFQV